jgi:hypothetical protein
MLDLCCVIQEIIGKLENKKAQWYKVVMSCPNVFVVFVVSLRSIGAEV